MRQDFTHNAWLSAPGDCPRLPLILAVGLSQHLQWSQGPGKGLRAEYPGPGMGAQPGSDAGFLPQEDAAGKGAGLGAVEGALGGPAAHQPGQAPPECGQPTDLEWGEGTGMGG